MLVRSRWWAAVAGVAVVVASCGGDDDAASESSPPNTAAAPATAPTSPDGSTAAQFNDADVEFAQGMIAHHEQAIAMAEIALDPAIGASPEVTDLAGRVQTAQDPEIELMTGWLTAWGHPLTMDESGGHDMESMEGMMTAEEMDALAAASGTEFDTMWLEMMIEHHTGAVAMAEGVKDAGVNADVRALADQIIAAQQAEIDEMTGLLPA